VIQFESRVDFVPAACGRDVRRDRGCWTPTALPNAMLAAGAFLVGRGTSHGFLLARLAKRWFVRLPWFGLMAGLAGPQSWDGWVVACGEGRGAPTSWTLRVVRRSPSPISHGSSIPGSQLPSLENRFLREMPKMVPKVVSVEIVPGAACQTAGWPWMPAGLARLPEAIAPRPNGVNRELRATLQELASLALRARHLIGTEPSQRAEDQASLSFDDAEGKSSSASRSRRGKRDQS